MLNIQWFQSCSLLGDSKGIWLTKSTALIVHEHSCLGDMALQLVTVENNWSFKQKSKVVVYSHMVFSVCAM